MAKFTLDFDKPYDEVEVDGKLYKIYYDDESLEKYRKQALKYSKEAKKYLKEQDKYLEMEENERVKAYNDGMEFVKVYIETFFGEGSFDELYEASGKSMLGMMKLVNFINEWLDGKTPNTGTKEDYYLAKKKKKK